MIDKENEEIAELIKEYHKKYNGLLGYRMMADRINRDHHKNYSDKRIYKICLLYTSHQSVFSYLTSTFFILTSIDTSKRI